MRDAMRSSKERSPSRGWRYATEERRGCAPASARVSTKWKREASGTPGSGRSTTAWIQENTAVFTPIPTPRERITTAERPGIRKIIRQAWRRSRRADSTRWPVRPMRISSLTLWTPPSSARAARVASAASMPAPRFRAADSSRYARSSSSTSRSRRDRDRSDSQSVAILRSSDIPASLFRLEHLADRAHDPRPMSFLGLELPPSVRGQRVALRTPAFRRRLPAPLDEALLGQAVQGREQRPRPHVERAARDLRDAVGDGHAMAGLSGETCRGEEIRRDRL